MNQSSSTDLDAKLPQALYANNDLQSEWWYYHGHLVSGKREFAFHLAFFRQRTDHLTIGRLIPLRFFSQHIRCAHLALTDFSNRQFHYGQQRSLRANAGADSEKYHVWHRDWMVRGCTEHHELKAKIRAATLTLSLDAVKPAVWNPYGGFLSVGKTCGSVHFSFPRMDATGLLRLNGEEFPVTGQAWMDREAGQFSLDENRHGWDWFAIQLQDNQELMVYRIHDGHRQPIASSTATLIDASNKIERHTVDEFEVVSLGSWRSPSTGNVYPVRWRVSSACLDADLYIESHVQSCEMDTRGSTGMIYWEGPAAVHGKMRGQAVQGRCFVELVGYDQLTKRLGVWDFSDRDLGFTSFLTNEIRLRFRGPGRTVTQI